MLVVRGPVALTLLILANVMQYSRIAEGRASDGDGVCFPLVAAVGVVIWLLAGGLWTECPRCGTDLKQALIVREIGRWREQRPSWWSRMLWTAYGLAVPRLGRIKITAEERACIAHVTSARLLRSWTFMLGLLVVGVLAANVLLMNVVVGGAAWTFLEHVLVSLVLLGVASAFLLGRIRSCATSVFSDWQVVTGQSYCTCCGYDLRGSEGAQCPECGCAAKHGKGESRDGTVA